MTLKYKLMKLHQRKEIITVCSVSQQDFNKGKRETLEFKIDNQWVELEPPIKDYKNYSHGICLNCVKIYYPQHYDKYLKLLNKKK